MYKYLHFLRISLPYDHTKHTITGDYKYNYGGLCRPLPGIVDTITGDCVDLYRGL